MNKYFLSSTHKKCRRSDHEERRLARQGQGQNSGGKYKEGDDEIKYGEPSVFGGSATQNLASDERPAHEGNWIEEQNS